MTKTPARQHPSYSPNSSPLLNEVRKVMRLKHMSQRTEASYLHYIIRFIQFWGKRHPREMGVGDIRTYRSHLATNKNVAASTQNVALYRHCSFSTGRYSTWICPRSTTSSGRRPKRVPVVALAEVEAILAQLTGTHLLVIGLCSTARAYACPNA